MQTKNSIEFDHFIANQVCESSENALLTFSLESFEIHTQTDSHARNESMDMTRHDITYYSMTGVRRLEPGKSLAGTSPTTLTVWYESIKPTT